MTVPRDRSSSTRSAARRLAARLPPPRGVALLEAGRALRALVTGRGAGPMTVLLQRVDAALEAGDAARATSLLEPALAADGWRRDLLRRAAAAHRLAGDAPGLLLSLSRLQQVGEPGSEGELRRVAGVVAVTQPGWAPDPDRGHPVEPASPIAVTRLLLATAEPAGTQLDAWPVTESVPVVETSVTNPYPEDAPLPDAIDGLAWLAARTVRPTRPALVAVEVAPGARELWYGGLVGLAVRASLRVPVVMGSCPEPPGGMLGEIRARETRARALAELDAAPELATIDPRLAPFVLAARGRRMPEPLA